METKTYDQPLERLYWSIGEVAEMFKVNASTIRFWLEEFSIVVKMRERGNRKFTVEDIARVREIHRLVRIEKYTLEGAKRQLSK